MFMRDVLRRIRNCFKMETHLNQEEVEKGGFFIWCWIGTSITHFVFFSICCTFFWNPILPSLSFFKAVRGGIKCGREKRARGLRGWLRSLAFVFAYFCYCHFIKVIKRWPLPPSYSLLLLPPIYSIFPPEFFSNRIYFCSVVLALTLVVMHQILRTI